jgi:hypothetical protein
MTTRCSGPGSSGANGHRSRRRLTSPGRRSSLIQS